MNDSIPLSYISQYDYCPRRAGLLLLEQAWQENEYTASGRAQHERVHDAHVERRGDLITLLDYPVASEKMGIAGKCDCLEATRSESGIALPCIEGLYQIYPIEYKHGVVRDEREYQLQLCAQAMCLEEMYGGNIEQGALFYTDAHRRQEVELSGELRAEVINTAQALQTMLETRHMPHAQYSAKCKKCSLLELCSPKLLSSASAYCAQLYKAMEDDE